MAKSTTFLLTLLLCFSALTISSSTVAASGDHNLSWLPRRGGRCEGSVAECMGRDEEFDMDSEINRRILATTQYISYQALQSDSVPCSQKGASYYNCKQGAEANPYNRGCSAITRCRG